VAISFWSHGGSGRAGGEGGRFGVHGGFKWESLHDQLIAALHIEANRGCYQIVYHFEFLGTGRFQNPFGSVPPEIMIDQDR
jgi:hypothetical protein